MDFSTKPKGKAELLQRIRVSRAALEKTLSNLNDAQMTTQGPRGAWSVKDHLAHLAIWEQMLIEIVQGRFGNAALQMDEQEFLAKNLDELNAIIYRRNKDRSLADVRRAFKESHERILAALDELNDAGLARPAFADDPTARLLLDKIIGDTYEHYAEHRGWIQELTEEIKKV